LKNKHIVVGLGEIGRPILNLLSEKVTVVGFDVNPNLMEKKFYRYEKIPTSFVHICIPFGKNFIFNVKEIYKKFKPKAIVIHSTISPYTTKKLQKKIPIPIIYSATRGVHKRMLQDLKRYTKFFAIEKNAPRAKWASTMYSKIMKSCKVKTKQMSSPLTLELAKIVCDTSYYGWLINYAQLSNMIAVKHRVNFDEMWTFADEIQKLLKNRPKMFPGFIGGHCIIPNLDLISDKTLNLIKEINSDYAKILSKRRKQGKKY